LLDVDFIFHVILHRRKAVVANDYAVVLVVFAGFISAHGAFGVNVLLYVLFAMGALKQCSNLGSCGVDYFVGAGFAAIVADDELQCGADFLFYAYVPNVVDAVFQSF
jgi:hypothetical protein